MNAKLVCATVSILALGSGTVQAQVPKATAADSVLVANNIYNRLFDGVAMSSDQRARALAIIRKDFLAKVELQLHERGNAAWAKTQELTVHRDSALKALITSSTDRKIFEQHAKSGFPRPPSG